MANFHVRCGACATEQDHLVPDAAALAARRCKVKACGAAALVRVPRGPSTQVVERLDNGAMTRPLERLADAERLHRERADRSDPLAGGAEFELPKVPG